MSILSNSSKNDDKQPNMDILFKSKDMLMNMKPDHDTINPELDKCPFCGSSAIYVRCGDIYKVACFGDSSDDCPMSGKHNKSREEAAKAWNTRINTPTSKV